MAAGTGSATSGAPRVPVVAFVRDPSLLRWIGAEFRHLDAVLRITYSHLDLEACLLRDPLPRPRLLLVSIDELSSEELCTLKRVRDGGWRGSIIALSRSRMLPALRSALGVDRLLTPPFVQDLFTDILHELRAQERREAEAASASASAVPTSASDDHARYRIDVVENARYRATTAAPVLRYGVDEVDAGDEATNRITTGSSSRYTATPDASVADSMANPSALSSEVSSSMRTNRR